MRTTMAVTSLLAAGAFAALAARAQTTAPAAGYTGDVVRIGVLTDMGGPGSAASGPGAVAAAQMAADEFGGSVNGARVDITAADHQGKPDVGSTIARRWFDVDGVDAIADMQGSPVALAVQGIARERRRIVLLSSATSSDLTGKACSPYSLQWTGDTYSVAVSAAKAISAMGGKRWFFLTVDQAYGHALTRDTMQQVRKAGGEVAGNAVFPANAGDFAGLLLQAQASQADVLALSSASGDTISLMKQIAEFGISRSMRVIPLQIVLPDTHAIGLEIAQGTYETAFFYWDRTPDTRAWSEQFHRRTHFMPSAFQAGVYSSVKNYLQAVQRAGTDQADAVMRELRSRPVNNVFATNGTVRQDGKLVHDIYLLRAKKPSEATGEWDLDEVVATLPGDLVARPLEEGRCPFVNAPAATGQQEGPGR